MTTINYFNNKTSIFFILSLILIFLSNNYFGEYDINSSANSGYYYLEIANSYPFVPEFENNTQTYIHSQRFIISYIIGFIGFNFKIKAFLIFKFFSIISLVIFLVTSIKIVKDFGLNYYHEILILSLIIFNPYIVRYFIANPMMLNDLIFFISINIIILGIKKSKDAYFYVGVILAIISRQTFIVILLSIIFTYVLSPNKNNYINKKKILFSLIFFSINFLITKYYLINVGLDQFYFSIFSGLFNFINNSFNFFELFIFISYPIFSFGPLLVIFIFKIYKNNFDFIFEINEQSIFYVLIILGLVAQPLIAGPEITGKNIIRLTSYCYIPIISLMFLNNKKKYIFKKNYLKYIILLLFFWSLHPTFSISSKLYNNFITNL